MNSAGRNRLPGVPASLRNTGLGRRLFTNTLHAASGRLATVLLWLFFAPPILQTLGPEGFAIWSLFYGLTGYLAALDFGLVQGTLRGVAAARGRGDHGEAGSFATLALLGYAALALLWFVVVAVAAEPILAWLRIPRALAGSAHFAMMLGVLAFLLSSAANVSMAVAQGYGRFDLANATLLCVAAQQALGMSLVLARGWGLEGLLINVALGWVVGGLVGVVLLHRGVGDFRWSRPRQALHGLRDAIRFGAPMQLANVLAVVNAQMDKVLLARFVGLVAVTSYELGSRVAIAATSLPQLLLLPVMAEASSMSASVTASRLRELYLRGSRYFLTASVLCVAPLLAAASRLYGAWIGGAQGEAALVLLWLTVSVAITLATGMGTTIARGLGRTDLEAWFAVATVGLHLALSLYLMPRVGLRGALVASLISHLAGSVLFMLLFARLTGWPLLGVVLRPWLVPALAILMGWVVGAALDPLMPDGAGSTPWMGFVAVGTAAGLGAFGVAVATGFFHWRETLGLLLGRSRSAGVAG